MSAFLVQGGTVLFPGPDPDWSFTLSLLYNGTVSDGIITNVTGYGFNFAQNFGERKAWHFDIEHTHLGLQSYSTDSNYTRFVDRVSGGEVGGRVYHGSGQSEQVVWKPMALPDL
jgi:hypothetical protein